MPGVVSSAAASGTVFAVTDTTPVVDIAPAFIRNPGGHLACYKARLAKRRIPQNGCGPIEPGDLGARISPAQPKHQKRSGVFVANQLGSGQLDTVAEVELCIPSEKNPTCGNGIFEPLSGEQCDDGNTFSGDGCSSTCVGEFCGDGITQFGIGEQCDGSDDFACPGECNARCQCPPPPCPHGVCETGAPLNPASCTDPCVNIVCNFDSFCCFVAWDEVCVDLARNLCGACGPSGSARR